MIFIIGNLNSGKTTLIRQVAAVKKIKVFSIDSYRREIGDGSIEREILAIKTFLSDVEDSLSANELSVIEIGGLGATSEALLSFLKKKKIQVLIIYLISTQFSSKEKLGRKTNHVPVPKDYLPAEKYFEMYLDREKKGEIYSNWGRIDNSVFVKIDASNIESVGIVQTIINEFEVTQTER